MKNFLPCTDLINFVNFMSVDFQLLLNEIANLNENHN